MTYSFRTITLVICLTATSAVVVDSDLSSADSSQSAASSQIIESRVRTPTPVVQTASHAEPLTDVQQGLVDWAKDRFTQAGLELPEFTVRFDPSRDLCNKADGRYHEAPNGERFVTICTRDGDTFGAQLTHRRTLLHEFGHAWDYTNMSADDHDELGQILGVDAWADHDDKWADRGIERFAETFVFALLDQTRRQVMVSLDCSELLSAFGTATGAEPLGPNLPYCAA